VVDLAEQAAAVDLGGRDAAVVVAALAPLAREPGQRILRHADAVQVEERGSVHAGDAAQSRLARGRAAPTPRTALERSMAW
jgi:hypothetical protein